MNIKCIDVMNFFTIGLLINKIWCYCHITFISWWNIFCIYFSVLIFDLLFESWMNVMSFTYISGVFLCFVLSVLCLSYIFHLKIMKILYFQKNICESLYLIYNQKGLKLFFILQIAWNLKFVFTSTRPMNIQFFC